MAQPRIEPGNFAWEATLLTITPHRLRVNIHETANCILAANLIPFDFHILSCSYNLCVYLFSTSLLQWIRICTNCIFAIESHITRECMCLFINLLCMRRQRVWNYFQKDFIGIFFLNISLFRLFCRLQLYSKSTQYEI